MTRVRRPILAAGIALAFAAIFWRRASFEAMVPFDVDTLCFYYPNWAIGRRLAALGSLAWDPFRNFGQPFLAVPQAQALYPFRFLSPLLTFADYTRLSIFFHSTVSAVFAFLLARRRGASDAGGAVAALAFAFAGPIVMRVVFAADFATIAWLPAALYFLSAGRAGWLGLVLAVQWFAGYPPLFLVGGAVLAAAASFDASPRRKWRVLLEGALWGGLLSAAQWIPFAEMMRASERAVALDPATALVNSTHPWDLLRGLLFPSILHDAFPRPWFYRPMFYIGPFVTALAVAGAAAERRRGWLLLGAAAVFFALALGHHNGVTGAFAALRVFRYPGNWALAGCAALALLAARGVDAIPSARARWIVAAVVALDLLAFAWPARHPWGDQRFLSSIDERLPGFDARPQGRVFHTRAIMERYPEWDWSEASSWPMLKTVLLPSYGTLFDLREGASHHNLTSRAAAGLIRRLDALPPNPRLFNYADVERIVTLTAAGAAKRSPAIEDFRVLANPDRLGRAFVVGGSSTAARLTLDRPGHLRLNAQGPGTLVISEGLSSGWRAVVNGRRAPVKPFEDAFLSVDVAGGDNDVELLYRPPALRAGAAVSVAAGALLIGLALWRRRKTGVSGYERR